jgi:hypothetical protein
VGENTENERAGIRTQNQWLKRTESGLRFLRPRACHFTLVHWTQSKESLLDAYFKGRVNKFVSSGFFYHKPVFTSLLFLPNNCTIVFWFVEDKGENIEIERKIVSQLPGCEGHGINKERTAKATEMQEKLGELLGRRIGDSLTISIFMNMENGIISTEDETLLRETGHSGWTPAFGRFVGMTRTQGADCNPDVHDFGMNCNPANHFLESTRQFDIASCSNFNLRWRRC